MRLFWGPCVPLVAVAAALRSPYWISTNASIAISRMQSIGLRFLPSRLPDLEATTPCLCRGQEPWRGGGTPRRGLRSFFLTALRHPDTLPICRVGAANSQDLLAHDCGCRQTDSSLNRLPALFLVHRSTLFRPGQKNRMVHEHAWPYTR